MKFFLQPKIYKNKSKFWQKLYMHEMKTIYLKGHVLKLPWF